MKRGYQPEFHEQDFYDRMKKIRKVQASNNAEFLAARGSHGYIPSVLTMRTPMSSQNEVKMMKRNETTADLRTRQMNILQHELNAVSPQVDNSTMSPMLAKLAAQLTTERTQLRQSLIDELTDEKLVDNILLQYPDPVVQARQILAAQAQNQANAVVAQANQVQLLANAQLPGAAAAAAAAAPAAPQGPAPPAPNPMVRVAPPGPAPPAPNPMVRVAPPGPAPPASDSSDSALQFFQARMKQPAASAVKPLVNPKSTRNSFLNYFHTADQADLENAKKFAFRNLDLVRSYIFGDSNALQEFKLQFPPNYQSDESVQSLATLVAELTDDQQLLHQIHLYYFLDTPDGGDALEKSNDASSEYDDDSQFVVPETPENLVTPVASRSSRINPSLENLEQQDDALDRLMKSMQKYRRPEANPFSSPAFVPRIDLGIQPAEAAVADQTESQIPEEKEVQASDSLKAWKDAILRQQSKPKSESLRLDFDGLKALNDDDVRELNAFAEKLGYDPKLNVKSRFGHKNYQMTLSEWSQSRQVPQSSSDAVPSSTNTVPESSDSRSSGEGRMKHQKRIGNLDPRRTPWSKAKIMDRIDLLRGMIESGNNNPALQLELETWIPYCVQNGFLTKRKAQQMLHSFYA